MTGVVVVVVRWVALVPATVLGALVVRYLFYLATTSFLGGENLFTGLPVGAVFAFAVGYFGTRIAPAHKRGVASVLLGLLGLVTYLVVGAALIALVRGDGVASWFTFGENAAVAATASILLAELARGNDPFTTPMHRTRGDWPSPKSPGEGDMINGPKHQIRITLGAFPSTNGPGFSADVRKLVDGSWEPVLVNGKPMEPTHSTEDGARSQALTALDALFGENSYELLD